MYEIYQRLLDERGLKNADIARATGISNMILSDWKRGKNVPKYDKMKKIAEYLNVSVDYLMTGKGVGIIVEKADKDSELLFMEKRIKEYALKLSKLSEEDKIQIMNMIDRLGKWGTVLWIVENVEKKWELEPSKLGFKMDCGL